MTDLWLVSFFQGSEFCIYLLWANAIFLYFCVAIVYFCYVIAVAFVYIFSVYHFICPITVDKKVLFSFISCLRWRRRLSGEVVFSFVKTSTIVKGNSGSISTENLLWSLVLTCCLIGSGKNNLKKDRTLSSYISSVNNILYLAASLVQARSVKKGQILLLFM